MRNPQFIYGQIVTEGGETLPDNTSIELRCGMGFQRAIHPDLNGAFQFNLQGGPQTDADMSADVGPSMQMGDQMGGLMSSEASARLADCELRISATGYQPVSQVVLLQDQDIGGVNAGTLVLTPLVMPASSTISVNTMLAPKNARKEYEHAEKDLSRGDLKSAEHHLKKCVAEYDKFAAAWNDLGRVYVTKHENDKAGDAFSKAIAADPNFVPPYVNLAEMQLRASDFQHAAHTAARALAVSPGLASASFIAAAADLRMGRFDAAEKNARDAENVPHPGLPQVHVLLADILLHKRDVTGAAGEMRAYLKEAPNGPLAAEVKDHLTDIEKLESREGSLSSQSAAKTRETTPSNSAAPSKP